MSEAKVPFFKARTVRKNVIRKEKAEDSTESNSSSTSGDDKEAASGSATWLADRRRRIRGRNLIHTVFLTRDFGKLTI